MSVKREQVAIDDGPESGQCSEEENEKYIIMQKKSKKHKKRSKGSRARKRKCSDSTSNSSKTECEFFNPYSVNTDRFNYRMGDVDTLCAPERREQNCELSDLPNDAIVNTISGIGSNDQSNDHCFPQKQSVPTFDYENRYKSSTVRKTVSQLTFNNRKSIYYFDKTGIESTNADLRYYLLDFGFSNSLVADVYSVLYDIPSYEPEHMSNSGEGENEEEVEENEEEMFNDLPIIELSANSHNDIYANSYSPEPVPNVIESYNSIEQSLPVSYAPICDSTTLKPLTDLIDPQSIPDVGPRDPRLNQSRPQLTKFANFIPKLSVPEPEPVNIVNPDKLPPKVNENNLQVSKEWEMTVANMVKTHLRLYLVHNDINKEEYKSILKRAVNKIINSGEKKLETEKISKFLHSYVIMMQKSRYVDSI